MDSDETRFAMPGRVGAAPDEDTRLQMLARYPDWATGSQDLEDIVRLAALICRTAFADIALLGEEDMFIQSQFGWGMRRLIDRQHAFARFVMERVDLVVINDALADPDYRNSPYVVGEPHVRFAAGVPILVEGHAIGTLCVFDTIVRDLSDEAAIALRSLARLCVSHLEMRRSLRIEREAEERLGLIFESATDYAIMSLGQGGEIKSWNAGARTIFGWDESEVKGLHVSALFTAADREAGVPDLDLSRAAEYGREINERYYERKNRSHFWGTGETMPLLTTTGETRGFLKILRDRTTQKRIKEALEYQTSVLQAITDHMAEALFQVDVDYRITFLNPAAEEMFGWSRYELIGVNLHDRLHYMDVYGATLVRDESPYVVALKSRASLIRRSDVFVHRDGHFIDVLVSLRPVVSEGVVTGGVLTLVDVTEANKIEEALRATQERYQLAVSASDIVGSWDWDLTTNVITADATFAEQYGVDPERAARGAPVADYQAAIHPDDRAEVYREIERSLDSRTAYVGEYRLLRPDGSIRWVSIYARAIYAMGGAPVRCPGLSVDITERKRNEERRAALLELEDALRNKETTAEIAGLAAEIVCRLLGVKRSGFGLVDPTGDYVTIERDHTSDGSQSIAGTYKFSSYGSYGEEMKAGGLVVVNDVAHDARTDENGARWRALDVGAVVNVPLKAESRLAAMFFAHSATPRMWTQDDIALIANIADRTWAAVARAQAAALERMLTGELRHRIKNTMTMIQSIAQQTMRKAATKEEAFDAFEARLLALSEAQNILTRSSWSAASMSDIVEGSLTPHRPADRGRIRVEGPETNLSAKTALSFALALHELATNATKYGALSNETGVVTITWAPQELDGAPVFRFRWQESGGPTVRTPTRKGFGTRLIKGGFARTFTITIAYDPGGVRCDVEGPMAAL